MTDGKDAVYSSGEQGLTKREYFAAMAMQGLCSHEEIGLESETKIAKVAVRQADALIAALNAD